MANLARLKDLVREFEEKYRGSGLEPFIFVDEYRFGCKEPWPMISTTHKGVYGIFSNNDLLYVGKVTGKTRVICHRMNDYFKIPEDFSYEGPKDNWSQEPTHFVAWGVPDDSFFEASSLEEFLIEKLKNELPDNTRK